MPQAPRPFPSSAESPINQSEFAQNQDQYPNQLDQTHPIDSGYQSESLTIESTYTPEAPTQTLWSKAYFDKLKEHIEQQYPHNSAEMLRDAEAIFAEIDRQALENFHSVESQNFPGTKYSQTSVRLDLQALARAFPERAQQLQSIDEPPQDYLQVVMIGGFAVPGSGHAADYMDGLQQRSLDEMTAVVSRLAEGRLAQVDITVLGNPIGHGGQVTPQWTQAISQHGLDAFADLYLPQLEQQILPPQFATWSEDDQQAYLVNRHFIGQGASAGAAKVEAIFNQLPQSVRSKSILRLDNPVGHYQEAPVSLARKAKIGLGIIGETARNLALDDIMKSIGRHNKDMGPQLVQHFNRQVGPDSGNKLAAFWAEAKALLKNDGPQFEAIKKVLTYAEGDMLVSDIFRRQRLKHRTEQYQQQAQQTGQPAKVPIYENQGRNLSITHGGDSGRSHFFDLYQRPRAHAKKIGHIRKLLNGLET